MVIGDHFGGGDHFDGGDHFGGGTGVKGCPLGLTIERICMQKSAQFLYSND